MSELDSSGGSSSGPSEANSCGFTPDDDYYKPLNIIAIFVILIASLFGTVLPLLAKHYPSFAVHPFIYTCGKHVGTGVLLSLSLIHLLAPAFDELGHPCLPDTFQQYQYAPLFALLAAIVMHFIECMAMEMTRSSNDHVGHAADDNDQSVIDIDTSSKSTTGNLELFDVTIYNKHKSRSSSVFAQSKQKLSESTPILLLKQPLSSSDDVHHSDYTGHSHSVLLSYRAQKTINAYILEFGLTSHSVIIGITLGVAAEAELNTLLPALAFHQFFEGFALGARLADVGFNTFNEILLLCVYSFSAPIGIAIGVGIVDSYNGNGQTANLIQGTFDAVSSGIILYIAFSQMLAIDFNKDYRECNRFVLKKAGLCISMWTGAGVMAVIGKWV